MSSPFLFLSIHLSSTSVVVFFVWRLVFKFGSDRAPNDLLSVSVLVPNTKSFMRSVASLYELFQVAAPSY